MRISDSDSTFAIRNSHFPWRAECHKYPWLEEQLPNSSARSGWCLGAVAARYWPPVSPVGVSVPIITSGDRAKWKFKIKGGAETGPHQLTFTGKDGSDRVRTATITMVVE